jgi:hypothetical protein
MAAQDDAEIRLEGILNKDLLKIRDKIVTEAHLLKFWKQ